MSTLNDYLQHVQTLLSAGNATKHTYRPALKTLLESLQPGIVATNEPKPCASCNQSTKPSPNTAAGRCPE